jgi:hypothetical protein
MKREELGGELLGKPCEAREGRGEEKTQVFSGLKN